MAWYGGIPLPYETNETDEDGGYHPPRRVTKEYNINDFIEQAFPASKLLPVFKKYCDVMGERCDVTAKVLSHRLKRYPKMVRLDTRNASGQQFQIVRIVQNVNARDYLN